MGRFNKTVKKSLSQRGGSVNFNIGNEQWVNTAQGNPNTLSYKYSQKEVTALNTLGIGTIHHTGSTQSFNPNSHNWYLIRPGTDPPTHGTTLSKVINEIYANNPTGAIDTFTRVQKDIASATRGREEAGSYHGNADPGHLAYLEALQNLVGILRTYTNPGVFTGATGIINSIFKRLTGNTAESNSDSDNESLSPKPKGKFERMSSERNGGKRKSRKSRKSRKIKFRKSKNKRQ